MIVFEVKLNGKLLAAAGREDISALYSFVTALGVLGKDSEGSKRIKDGCALSFEVGGISSSKTRDTCYKWVKGQGLEVGDEVVIRICDRNTAGKPVSIFHQDKSDDNVGP